MRPVSIESTTRGSRSMFCTFLLRGREPMTISSPSTPIHTHDICGLWSGFSVTMWARRPDSRAAIASGEMFATRPDRRGRDKLFTQPVHPRLAHVAFHDPRDVPVGRAEPLLKVGLRVLRRSCGGNAPSITQGLAQHH